MASTPVLRTVPLRKKTEYTPTTYFVLRRGCGVSVNDKRVPGHVAQRVAVMAGQKVENLESYLV